MGCFSSKVLVIHATLYVFPHHMQWTYPGHLNGAQNFIIIIFLISNALIGTYNVCLMKSVNIYIMVFYINAILANNKNKYKRIHSFSTVTRLDFVVETYSQVGRMGFGVNSNWIQISEPTFSNSVPWASY